MSRWIMSTVDGITTWIPVEGSGAEVGSVPPAAVQAKAMRLLRGQAAALAAVDPAELSAEGRDAVRFAAEAGREQRRALGDPDA